MNDQRMRSRETFLIVARVVSAETPRHCHIGFIEMNNSPNDNSSRNHQPHPFFPNTKSAVLSKAYQSLGSSCSAHSLFAPIPSRLLVAAHLLASTSAAAR